MKVPLVWWFLPILNSSTVTGSSETAATAINSESVLTGSSDTAATVTGSESILTGNTETSATCYCK